MCTSQLQQEKPEDFVIATGEMHTVRDHFFVLTGPGAEPSDVDRPMASTQLSSFIRLWSKLGEKQPVSKNLHESPFVKFASLLLKQTEPSFAFRRDQEVLEFAFLGLSDL